MTRVAYWLLVAVLAATALGGLALAAPTPAELGWIDHEMTCAEWFASPSPPTGSVRLTECALGPDSPLIIGREGSLDVPRLAADRSFEHEGVTAGAARLWAADGDTPPGRALVLVTHDPALRRLTHTFAGSQRPWWTGGAVAEDAAASRARFLARHKDELRAPRVVEGVVEDLWTSPHSTLAAPLADGPPAFVIAPPDARRLGRAPGIATATLAGLALFLLVLLQRRWTRRREELLGGASRPLTF